MNRGIIFLLGGIIVFGMLALYALQRGPVLLLSPPAEERIAFVSDRTGKPDIWTMRTDGSDARPVTQDPSDDQLPRWSPDGKEILSISDRRNQVYQIFISAWDGRYVNPLTISEGTKDSPVWSSDGREITFISGGKVFSRRRDGGREEQLLPPRTAMIAERAPFVFADWSSDGDYLLVVQETDQGREVYGISRASIREAADHIKNPLRVTRARHIHTAWIPHTLNIVVSYIDRNGDNGILIADLRARDAGDLYVFDTAEAGPGRISVSPDGKKIAFEKWLVRDGIPNRPEGIYVMDISNSEPRALKHGRVEHPTWSADSSQVTFSMFSTDGMRDIWSARLDGSDPVNLTGGEGDNYHPAWIPLARSR